MYCRQDNKCDTLFCWLRQSVCQLVYTLVNNGVIEEVDRGSNLINMVSQITGRRMTIELSKLSYWGGLLHCLLIGPISITQPTWAKLYMTLAMVQLTG